MSEIQTTGTITVTSNIPGDVTVASANESIVTATASGKVVTVEAKAIGETNVTITAPVNENFVAPAPIVCPISVVEAFSTPLADCSPARIKEIINDGNAPNAWVVGDQKQVNFRDRNGFMASSLLTTYLKIIGINHNVGLESASKPNVHFKFPYDATGKQLCLVGTDYGQSIGKNQNGFCMNPGDNTNNYGGNAGGWKNAYARNTLMPKFLAGMPTEWQEIISETTKYTDNVGNATTAASNVTATQDKVFYLSEYEMFGPQGANSCANEAEPNFQKQYAYYANHNTNVDRIHYAYNAATTAHHTWLRSPDRFGAYAFVIAYSSGRLGTSGACYSRGAAPAFGICADALI